MYRCIARLPPLSGIVRSKFVVAPPSFRQEAVAWTDQRSRLVATPSPRTTRGGTIVDGKIFYGDDGPFFTSALLRQGDQRSGKPD